MVLIIQRKSSLICVLILGVILISGCISGENGKTQPNETAALPAETEAPTTSPTITSPTTSAPEQTAEIKSTVQPPKLPKGTPDPDITVGIYKPDKVWNGLTLLPDNHKRDRPRIIEVNMLGEIVWQYQLPDNLKEYTNTGLDAELLSNNNILIVLTGKGLFEINRNGTIVWSYEDPRVSHDADRLPNGNTLFVFGMMDSKNDAQVKEVNQEGQIVWEWHARDYFDKAPYTDIDREGWTHTNAVIRLPNGNTIISLRNFNFVVEVDPTGSVVRTYGEGIFIRQHDPEILPNGNMLVASHSKPQKAIELDSNKKVVWEFTLLEPENYPLRDANRLPNGNTLITGTKKIVEVTSGGELVWELKLNANFQDAKSEGFYKAYRIDPQ